MVGLLSYIGERKDWPSRTKSLGPGLFKGLLPHIHEVDLGEKGQWFRLQIGPPQQRDKIDALCEQFRRLGHVECRVVSPFVVANRSPGYSGTLIIKPESDGVHMTTVEAVEFVDRQGRKWMVPSGTKTDGASIPRPLWSIVGSPFTGLYLKAAVLHDHYVRTKQRSWMDTHDVFYEAMVSSGVGAQQALVMWAAVYRFGPRWAKRESSCWKSCSGDFGIWFEDATILPEFSENDLETIRRHANTFDGIEAFKTFIDSKAMSKPEARLVGWVSVVDPDANRDSGIEFTSERAPDNWTTYGTDSSGTGPRLGDLYYQ